MIMYHKVNWIGALIVALKNKHFLKNPQDVKFGLKYNKALYFFKWGFITEINDEFLSDGELYDVKRDKLIKTKVQKSKITVYEFSFKYPFIKVSFELTKTQNPNFIL